MLRRTRRVTAFLFFVIITLLFLDFTGTLHHWLGWVAQVQFVPALLAHSVGILAGLLVLTLLFGRIYCSVICPLGVLQDGVSNIAGRRKGKKNRFGYSPAVLWLRYGVLVLFVAALVIPAAAAIASLLDPYAAFGRIASNIVAPVYRWGNNLLAWMAERAGSYAFYSVDVWVRSAAVLGVAVLTLAVVAILAWRNGRTWCNTVCPVGTFLGFVSRFSLFRHAIDAQKCTQCGACERKCKASCIDSQNMSIDRSRCVSCFNCIGSCKSGAMKYTAGRRSAKSSAEQHSNSTQLNIDAQSGIVRRSFLSIAGVLAVASTVKSQVQLQVDGGLAEIEDKKVPNRKTPVVPPGALAPAHLNKHCTACQLCVSSCPNNVLRPSSKLATLMQPEMTFERGYCRPECVECSLVCPNKAIGEITVAEKTAISIGKAVWITENCIVNTDEVPCTACERHCPTAAVRLIASDPNNPKNLKIPVIDNARCIGCGACEYHCPARPFSAIYVEGNERHHEI